MIRKAYQHILARVYDPFLSGLEKTLSRHRKELLSQTHGKILEVGAGTGVNFSLYPENTQIIALEPSGPMLQMAKKKLNRPNIKLLNMSLEEFAEAENSNEQFDFIVSMLVLCTVKDPIKSIEIYKKFIKPDGKLLVLEHIHAENSMYGKLQSFINPIWKPLADGCNLTRRQDKLLKENGFIPIEETYFRTGTDWYKAVMKKKI